MSVTSCPSSFKICLVTTLLAIPVVGAYSSAWQNSNSLIVVFVTMQKGLRFTSAQLHRFRVPSVYTFTDWEYDVFYQALCIRDAFHLLDLNGTKIIRVVSCTLYLSQHAPGTYTIASTVVSCTRLVLFRSPARPATLSLVSC